MKVRTWKWATAGLALGLLAAACATTKIAGGTPQPQPPVAAEPAPPPAPAPVTPGGFASSGNGTFDTWRDDFAAKAAMNGRRTDRKSVV